MDRLPSVQMKDTETGRHGDAVTKKQKDGEIGR